MAASGAAAPEALESSRFALAPTGCQMPGIDSYQTAAEIPPQGSQRPWEARTARIPIVAMTAKGIDGNHERCLAAGMRDYLTKPIRLQALEGALGRWPSVARRRSARDGPSARQSCSRFAQTTRSTQRSRPPTPPRALRLRA
jgi:CheY-like chemotaxis protein